jgi:hypothetical protein
MTWSHLYLGTKYSSPSTAKERGNANKSVNFNFGTVFWLNVPKFCTIREDGIRKWKVLSGTMYSQHMFQLLLSSWGYLNLYLHANTTQTLSDEIWINLWIEFIIYSKYIYISFHCNYIAKSLNRLILLG